MSKLNNNVTKEMYAKYLLSKLNSMLEDNEKAELQHSSVTSKMKGNFIDFWDSLTEKEKEIYHQGGRIHSKASISRARIELNKVLIEIEREM
jgi:hypothetical protein